MNSVFSGLSFNRFDEVHAVTSSIQRSILERRSATLDGLQVTTPVNLSVVGIFMTVQVVGLNDLKQLCRVQKEEQGPKSEP